MLDGKEAPHIDRAVENRQLQMGSLSGNAPPPAWRPSARFLSRSRTRTWPDYCVALPDGYPKTEAQLMDAFRTARAKNFAIDFNECDYGTCGVISSFKVNDRLTAACSINSATVCFEEERLYEMADLVEKMAEELAVVAARIPARMSFRDLGYGQQDAVIPKQVGRAAR